MLDGMRSPSPAFCGAQPGTPLPSDVSCSAERKQRAGVCGATARKRWASALPHARIGRAVQEAVQEATLDAHEAQEPPPPLCVPTHEPVYGRK